MSNVAPDPRESIRPVTRLRLSWGSARSLPLRQSVFLMCSVLWLSVPAYAITDWTYFWKAGRAVLSCQNPYTTVPGFYSPVHTLIYFVPLSVMPLEISARVNAVVGSLVIVAALWRFSGCRWQIVLVALLFPWPLSVTTNGNIEWVALAASLVNPLAGVFIALAKPQIASILIALLLLLIWRRYGWRVSILACSGVAAIMAVTFALGARWGEVNGVAWDRSPWPYGLLLGVPMAYIAIKRNSLSAALAASPFFTPYMAVAGFVVTLPLVMRLKWAIPPLLIASWALMLAYRASLN